MPAYPTFSLPSNGQLKVSNMALADDLRIDRTTDGTPYGRGFYPTAKKRFVVKHRLNATQEGTLQAHYEANRFGSGFDFVWVKNGVTYTVIYEGPPIYDYSRFPWVDAEVHLAEA